MPKWNGGVIGVANNPTQSSAKGIWSLSEATKAIRAGLWPPSNAGADPYFENVTMLLSADGTNGAQNNTFLDSSTNNFTITRNGNTTQGTFTPFSKPDGRWSNYFDNSGDYLTIPSNTAFDVGSGNFTVECWAYPTTWDSVARGIFAKRATTSAVNQIGLEFSGSSGTIRFAYNSGGSEIGVTGGSGTLNTWQHIAVVRNGTALTIYKDGVSVGTATINVSIGTNADNLSIGSVSASGQFPMDGYITNFRFVKGTAVYTGAFTPPTAPLTAITNTSLLTCQSNRFRDNSTSAFAITRNGDVSVQTFSPFTSLTAYASGTNGGSGYFDGTGDFLQTPSNAAFGFGTGDFHISFWAYLLSDANKTFFGNVTDNLNLYVAATTKYIGLYTGSTNDSTTLAPLNQWAFFVITRTGSTLQVYLNNTSILSISNSTNFATTSYIIGNNSGTSNINAYISNFKIVKGVAWTPAANPTAPLTSDANTSLLCNFTNGGIVDAAMSNDLETVGGAQISTTQSKFGGASMYFDGSGDDLIVPYNPVFGFGTGDFTVEGWFYFSDLNTTARGIVALGDGANGGGPYTAWSLRYFGSEGSNQIAFSRYDGTAYDSLTTGVSLSANTWYHIAVSRSSGTLKIFVNGTSYYSATVTTSFAPVNTNPLRVALQYYGPAGGYGGPRYWQGYIDDLRITKGYGRYTANFTPPVGAFVGFGD